MQISVNLDIGFPVFSICTGDKKRTWHQKCSKKVNPVLKWVYKKVICNIKKNSNAGMPMSRDWWFHPGIINSYGWGVGHFGRKSQHLRQKLQYIFQGTMPSVTALTSILCLMKSCFTVISEVPASAMKLQDFLKPKSVQKLLFNTQVHTNVKITNRQQIKTSTSRPAGENL